METKVNFEIIKVEEEGTALQEAVRLFKDYQLELNADLCFQSFEKELANPLIKYGAPKGCLLLVKVAEVYIACVALQDLGNGSCEMKRLYVEPTYRKHKIGEALVIAILQEAKALGYTTMKLDTLRRLEPAMKLYEKYGLVTTNAYYDNPLEEVVYMEKSL